MSKPIGWLTDESYNLIKVGGNHSRGTVPLHSDPSSKAYIPLYAEGVKASTVDTSNLVTVELDVERETYEFIEKVAAQSGVTPDQAASVITVLAMTKYIGPIDE